MQIGEAKQQPREVVFELVKVEAEPGLMADVVIGGRSFPLQPAGGSPHVDRHFAGTVTLDPGQTSEYHYRVGAPNAGSMTEARAQMFTVPHTPATVRVYDTFVP